VSGLFFPQRVVLKIDQRQYTPLVLDKIAFAGGSHASWKKGVRALAKLATPDISAKEVSRITLQIGQELLERQERDAVFHQRRQLTPTNAQPVEIACVEVDGVEMVRATPPP
jgi:hypothetical protein